MPAGIEAEPEPAVDQRNPARSQRSLDTAGQALRFMNVSKTDIFKK